MKKYVACWLTAGVMLALSACGEKAATTEVAVVATPPAAAQANGAAKPASVVEEFTTSSMPDSFTIPHNTCEQGKKLEDVRSKLLDTKK
jgi:hypothetical protein